MLLLCTAFYRMPLTTLPMLRPSSSHSTMETGKPWSTTQGTWPASKKQEFWIKQLYLNIFRLGRDLNVMTGTHDILEYPNIDNILTPIYLYNSSNVPAPKYYWKVVRDPQTDTAAAFIGLNDPHAKTAPEELCKNRWTFLTKLFSCFNIRFKMF